MKGRKDRDAVGLVSASLSSQTEILISRLTVWAKMGPDELSLAVSLCQSRLPTIKTVLLTFINETH